MPPPTTGPCGGLNQPACPPVNGVLPGEKIYSRADMIAYAAQVALWALDNPHEARAWIKVGNVHNNLLDTE
jgi:hypothetical protein